MQNETQCFRDRHFSFYTTLTIVNHALPTSKRMITQHILSRSPSECLSFSLGNAYNRSGNLSGWKQDYSCNLSEFNCTGTNEELLIRRNWILFTSRLVGHTVLHKRSKHIKNTSLLILLVSATRSESTEFWTGGAAIGCIAISWILLGTRLLASEERDIRSTCSKMEAEECCSLPLLLWGGPELPEQIKSKAAPLRLSQSNDKLYRCYAMSLCHVFRLCLIYPIGLPSDSHLSYNKFAQQFANYKHFLTTFSEDEPSFFISVNQTLGICKPSKSQCALVHKRLFKHILLMVPLISTYGDANSTNGISKSSKRCHTAKCSYSVIEIHLLNKKDWKIHTKNFTDILLIEALKALFSSMWQDKNFTC